MTDYICSNCGQNEIEDLSELFSNIPSTQTPFLSSIGRCKIHNIAFQWMQDKLQPEINAQPEGFTVTAPVTPPKFHYNVTQIFQKTVSVSGSYEDASRHDREKEMAYQTLKIGKSLLRDVEYAFIGSQQTLVNGLTRVTAGVQALIAPENIFEVDAFTEDALLDAWAKILKHGGEPTTVFLSPLKSVTLSNWGKEDREQSTVTNAVSIYRHDVLGELRIVMDRFIAEDDIIICDPEDFDLCIFRDWRSKRLASSGDFESKLLVGEFGLRLKHDLAAAIIRVRR